MCLTNKLHVNIKYPKLFLNYTYNMQRRKDACDDTDTDADNGADHCDDIGNGSDSNSVGCSSNNDADPEDCTYATAKPG